MTACTQCTTPTPIGPVDKPPELDLVEDATLTSVFTDQHTIIRMNPKVLSRDASFVRVYFGTTYLGYYSIQDTWYLPPLKYLEKIDLIILDTNTSELLFKTVVVRNE